MPSPSLYKYVELKWARAFVDEGSAMFSSLAWFQECEDPSRGEEFEGVRKYFPLGGLTITRESEPRASWVDPDRSFQSAARERDHIFIFSVSRALSPKLKAKFAGSAIKDMACVEIHDVGLFCDRLARALGKRSLVQRRTLFRDDVTYYRFEDPPGNVWPQPRRLATHKEESRFSDEEEHRFLFSTRRNAFAFDHVDKMRVHRLAKTPRRTLDPAHHRRPIVLGPLGDCCRVIPCP